jgi:1,2-diacylglycerol 3-alpha-glucosyltransferase
MIISVCFTNFGPYHLARLRALADRLTRSGDRLLAIEVASQQRLYPWSRSSGAEPFDWITLFPGRALETVPREECIRGMRRVLDANPPDGLGIVGYIRPESMAALNWARKHRRPTILMSESQEMDLPRTWWKEAIKRRRVARFSSGLVGGPRHRDYLVKLGMDRSKIAFGYNAVDNSAFAARAEAARRSPDGRRGLPERPYFLATNRFASEKNLSMLVGAFARYRLDAPTGLAWDLVLCGDGPDAGEVDRAIRASSVSRAIHRPGFLQAEEMAPWLAFASAFVHPSLLEPWGLVVNEAAACGLPLLVSDRAGCVETMVPDPPGTTGRRFDPRDELEITSALAWISGLPESERRRMGQKAAEVAGRWGPERFAEGTVEALALAGLTLETSRPSPVLVEEPSGARS